MNSSSISPMMILAAVTAGCLSGTDVTVQELEGMWVATDIVFINAAANPADIEADDEVNLVQLGYSATMDIGATGDFTLLVDDGMGDVETTTGVLQPDGNNLVVTIEDETLTGEIFLQDNQLSIQLRGGASYDFSGTGQEEPAALNLVMERI